MKKKKTRNPQREIKPEKMEKDESNLKKLTQFDKLWEIKSKMLNQLDETICLKEELLKTMNQNLEDIGGIINELENIHKEKQKIAKEIQKAKKKMVENEELLFRKTLGRKLERITQEQGEEYKVVLPLKKIKKATTSRMPIIMAMFMIITSQIDSTMGSDKFKPVEEETPWFNLTPQEEITMIEKENLTMVVQTNQHSPFLSTTKESLTPGYHKTNTYIDLKLVARDLHNSKIYMENHQKKRTYYNQNGFISVDNLYQQEYKSLGTRSYDNCDLGCTILNASLPTTSQEVKEAAQVLRLPTSTHMWVPSNQKSQKISTSYSNPFQYELSINRYQVFPQKEGGIPYNLPARNCKVIKNGTEITKDEIGYDYSYYSSDGRYHVMDPYRLEIATNKLLDCKVIVHQKGHTDHNNLQECTCTRTKLEDNWKENSLQVGYLQHKITDLNTIKIEDWRLKTSEEKISEVEEDEHNNTRLVPRHVESIDKYKIRSMKTNYIFPEDIKDLKITSRKARSLPAKEMLKKLTKTVAKKIITNPHLVKNLYKEVQTLLKDNPNKQTMTRKTKELFGTTQDFLTQINRIAKDFHITKNNSLIKILPITYNTPDWKKLEESTNPKDASKGIHLVKQSVLLTQKIQNKVIPAILENILLSKEEVKGKKVNMEEDSILQISITGTIMKIEINIPIQLEERTKTMHTISLPHEYDETKNEYLVKDIPPFLDLANDQELTPCLMELISQHTAQTCQNKPTRFKSIQTLGSIGFIEIYFFKDVGTVSISCPTKRNRYYKMEKQVNILLVHKGCSISARENNYNIQILPNTTKISQDLSSMQLLAYNLSKLHIPTIETRWILLISVSTLIGCILLGILSCVIGILVKKPFITRLQLPQNSNENEDQNQHSYRMGTHHFDLEEPITSSPFHFEDALNSYYQNIHKIRKSDVDNQPMGKSGTPAGK